MEKMTNGTPARKAFAAGVFFLGAANILVKVLGLLFKIPMSYYLGDEGMGYFNSAYQIYVWLYMLSTAGLPVAVSILIAGARAEGDADKIRRVFRITWRTFLLLGIGGAAFLFFGAGLLSHAVGAPDARFSVAAIAPTLFFICLSGALRGYFQGFQQMGPPAVSQVIEAVGKLGVGVALAAYAHGAGLALPVVSAYAVAGLAVGEAGGTLYLFLALRRASRKGRFDVRPAAIREREDDRTVFARLLRIALPITCSASVMSLTGLVDLAVIQRRLQDIGYTAATATSFYGNYTTLAVPLFNLPPALIYPITTALIPLLSAKVAAEERAGAVRVAHSVMRLTSLIAMPCALGLTVFSGPILRLLFRADMAATAAPLLSVLGPAVLFLCWLTVSNAILQAYGRARLSMISMLCGAAVKTAANYILLGIPSVGTYGVPLSTLLCYATAFSINLVFLFRVCGALPASGAVLFRPLFAAALAVGAGLGVYLLCGGASASRILILPVIAVTALVYAAGAFLLGCVTEEELRILPGVSRFARVFPRSGPAA